MAAPENQCERMQDMLSLFVDGRLSPADTTRVEAHVARCADCASYLGFLRATNFAIAHRPAMTPPAALYARIAQMTPERLALPTVTWGQRLSSLLAPAPTRWALGTALAAAGLVGVAVLPHTHDAGNPIAASGHKNIPVAVASPKALSTTEATKTQVAVMRPVATRSMDMPTVKSPAAPAVTVAAAPAPRQVAATVPHSFRSAVTASKSTVAAVLAPQAKRSALPAVPASTFTPRLAADTPRLAVVTTTPKNSVAPVATDPVAESIRKIRHEQEAQQKERNARLIADRSMELGQRNAANNAHEGIALSVPPRQMPVEPPVSVPSAPTTIAINTPPQTQVAVVSSSPGRHNLFGSDTGQKMGKYTLAVDASSHGPAKRTRSLRFDDTQDDRTIPIVQDKPTDEKSSQSLQN